MKGTAGFVILMLLIAPKSRALLGLWVGDAGKWMMNWAPFSFVILAFLMIAPVVSVLLMVRWPKQPEPENPLAKYKEDVTWD